MKAFIIYVQDNDKSEQYANQVLESMKAYKNWEPELFAGMTPKTLSLWEEKFQFKMKPNSRAEDFFRESVLSERHLRLYQTKKCCTLNQYRLLKLCTELKEPIAIIEHDSICIGDWSDIQFEDMLVLNPASGINQEVFSNIHALNQHKILQGVHDMNFNGLRYGASKGSRGNDKELEDACIMPGLAAYAVTPKGAQKMVDVYENIGWEQGDMIINTGYVRIQTLMPELFTLNESGNLRMSHGENME